MRNREVKMKPLAASILSLSLLTVMAGAAVAPALEVIRRHFSDASQLEVQLVVCMPALFIVITNMFFGRLASRFGARTLTMVGLALYTVGGAAAGTIAGSALVGFANGVGVPFIISSASANEGKAAATTVMPLISASLYLSQFLSPFILSLVSGLASGAVKLPYYLAVGVSAAFLLFTLCVPGKTMNK